MVRLCRRTSKNVGGVVPQELARIGEACRARDQAGGKRSGPSRAPRGFEVPEQERGPLGEWISFAGRDRKLRIRLHVVDDGKVPVRGIADEQPEILRVGTSKVRGLRRIQSEGDGLSHAEGRRATELALHLGRTENTKRSSSIESTELGRIMANDQLRLPLFEIEVELPQRCGER